VRHALEPLLSGISIQWQELGYVFSVKAAGVLAADVTPFGDLLDAVRA
jgi:hypothetical protein